MDVSGMQLRALRAAVFTALVVTLSAASHVLLSGAPLPWVTVAGLCAVVFALAYALSGRERGYWRIAGLLVPLELAADTVFNGSQDVCYGPGGGPVTGSLRALGLDVLCGGSVGGGLPGVAGAEDAAAALLHPADPASPWVLLAAHVSVGLLAAVWLRHGEAALASLVRTVGAFAFRPLLLAVAAVVAHRPVRRVVRSAPRHTASRALLLVHALGRRGPPRSGADFALCA
ncbi:hypothetical protein ACIBCM_02635 [Streptomyces sp. NPDC051018]|uniref:hypothetical protein n=1 Tax=Streptomyces sp. NPDC051018 TaxID=3365639 RepID=UPI0037BB5217